MPLSKFLLLGRKRPPTFVDQQSCIEYIEKLMVEYDEFIANNGPKDYPGMHESFRRTIRAIYFAPMHLTIALLEHKRIHKNTFWSTTHHLQEAAMAVTKSTAKPLPKKKVKILGE